MKDLNALSALTLSCELLSAAIQLRGEAQAKPWNRFESLRILAWMHQRGRKDIDVTRLGLNGRNAISADGVVMDTQKIIDDLMWCRAELRAKDGTPDVARIDRTLKSVALGIDQLLGGVSASIAAGSAHRRVA